MTKSLLSRALEVTGAKAGVELPAPYSGKPSPTRHSSAHTQELVTTDEALEELGDELIEAEQQGRAMSSATAKTNAQWGQW